MAFPPRTKDSDSTVDTQNNAPRTFVAEVVDKPVTKKGRTKLNGETKGKYKLFRPANELQGEEKPVCVHACEDEQEIVDVFKDYGLSGWTIKPEDPRVTNDPEVIAQREAAKVIKKRAII